MGSVRHGGALPRKQLPRVSVAALPSFVEVPDEEVIGCSLLALAAVVLTSDSASAQIPGPGPFGFLPFGFYQPYGATYGNSIRTPPYFATNPPVYYGARHSRPYGLSPFAAPPMVVPGDRYRSRLRTQFLQPRVPTPEPMCNPCGQPFQCRQAGTKLAEAGVSENKLAGSVSEPKLAQVGPVRSNPLCGTDRQSRTKLGPRHVAEPSPAYDPVLLCKTGFFLGPVGIRWIG